VLCSLFRLQTGRVPTGPYQANHSDHDRTTQPPPLGRSAGRPVGRLPRGSGFGQN